MTAEMRRPRGSRPTALALITVTLVLLALSSRSICAQAVGVPALSQFRAWAFGRLGPAQTTLPGSPIFASFGGGVAASYGAIVGILRATDNEYSGFEDNPPPGEQDYAVLAGVRSPGDGLFVVGAAGLAQSVRSDIRDSFGALISQRRLAPAFDLSAHADYRVAGLSLTVSGVLGPPSVRYAALSLGAELGWFGSRSHH